MWVRFAIVAALTAAAALTGCNAKGEYSRDELPPRATQRDVATLEEAVALAMNFEYAIATGKLLQVAPRFEAAGDKRRAADSLFWLGFCHQKQGKSAEARQVYTTVVQKYPREQAAGKAREYLETLPATATPGGGAT